MIDPNYIAALSTGSVFDAYLIKIELGSITIRWSDTLGDVEYGGETYIPGRFGSPSPVNMNKIMDTGFSLVIDGTDDAIRAAFLNANSFNAKVTLVHLVKSKNGIYQGSRVLFIGFISDPANIAIGDTQEITIGCKGYFSAMNRERAERYTNEEQQRLYPGDLGFSTYDQMNQDVFWPTANWFKNNG